MNISQQTDKPKTPVQTYSDTTGDNSLAREAIAAVTNYGYQMVNPEGTVGDYINDPATAQALLTKLCKDIFGDKKEMTGAGFDDFVSDHNMEEVVQHVRDTAKDNTVD